MKDQAGFTLTELMIVITIVGILASIALPAYQDYVKRSHVFEGMALATSAKTAMWDYWTTHGTFPSNNTSAGLSNTISGNAVNSVILSGTTITITYNTRVSSGVTIELSITNASNGSLSWDCTGGNMTNKYRPIDCR